MTNKKSKIKMKGITVTPWGVYSVWHRHARVYQKTWLVNSLPPLSEPLIYLVAFGYGLSPLVGDVSYNGQTISYLRFLAPGMIASGMLFQAFFEGAYGSFFRLNYQKTWKALLTAPLSFTEVFLGDCLWATTKGVIAGLVTGLVAVVWGLYSGWHLLLSLPLIVLGSLLFAAMGMSVAGTVRTIDQINVPIFLLIVPMFSFCGIYFPRSTLPPLLNNIASIFPIASIVDLLRWPLGLPGFWLLELLWLLLLMSVFAVLAWRQIYPLLFR